MAEAPGEEAWIATSRPASGATPLTEEEALLAAAQQAALALGSWKQDARRDPVIFSQYVLRDERTGARVQMAPHHIRWQDFISQKQRSLILAHIEAAKSSAITVGRTLWELGNDNNLRGAIISNTHAQATKLVRAVAGYIVGSADYQTVFPEVKPSTPWTDSAITIKRRGVPKDPSLQALGIHGAIQGARLDYVVIDDILDFENARTPQSRQQLADWFTSAVLGRLSANGKLIVVGTAFHPDDLLHRLAATPPFRGRMMKTPVLDPETGQSSWPERWPMSRIEYKRQELGPLEFARQMLCEARDDTESRFKREWIEGCKARGLGKTPAWALSGLPAGYAIVTGVDLAVQQHSAADLTVFFTLVVHPDETREVLSVEAGRWVGPEIIDRLADIHHRYHGIIVVENNASQDFIRQFAATRGIETIPFTTGRQKAHPEYGIEGIAAELSARKWIIPNLGGICDPQIEAWIGEMLWYNPQGHTGDRLMAAWFAREGARQVKMHKAKAQTGRLDLGVR